MFACPRILNGKHRAAAGKLISETVLHHSNDLFFRERLPWRLGLVQLDTGPTLMVHLLDCSPSAPARVKVHVRLDRAGQAVLLGFPETETEHMSEDRVLREMTCDPKFRKVLVTDGKTAVGQAIVKALVVVGADIVWVGHAEPWKKLPGLEGITSLPQVTLVPLDLTSAKSVSELAGEVAGKVDIVINNAEVHRRLRHRHAPRRGCRARGDGHQLLRAAAPRAGIRACAQRARRRRSRRCGSLGQPVSIYALSNYPPHGTYSASKAAALSLAQCLRAEMRPAGIRVINLFPGPIDDEWNQLMPPPKITPASLAQSIVKALRDGVEDVYPGDVAQEWLARWRENPKVLERELAAGGS